MYDFRLKSSYYRTLREFVIDFGLKDRLFTDF